MKSSRLATALFLLTLLFYTITLQPSLAWGDGIRLQREAITAESFIFAEMVDVAFAPDPWPFARLGVAAWDHPLYVIIGHLLVQALPGFDPLWLVNFLSALFGAASLALFFAWCYRHLGSLFASLFAALSLGLSHTFWWHAATPEVYTLFTFLLLATVLLYERYEKTDQPRYLYAAAFTLGLGAANHLLALLAIGALALKKLITADWRRLTRSFIANPQSPKPSGFSRRPQSPAIQSLISSLFFFLFGFSPYLIQLLRLLRTFTLSEVMGPAVGVTFLQGSLALSPAALAQSLLSYATFLFYQFSPIGVLLGLVGWWWGRRLAPAFWRSTLALYLVYLFFGLGYQVSDQFAFFLGAHLFWAAAIGMGVTHVAQGIGARRRRWLASGLALHLLLMPLLYSVAPFVLRATGVTASTFGIPQVGNGVRDGLTYYLNPNKRGDRQAYNFGRDVLQGLPPQALVVAEWYVDTDEYFILRYFIAVEGLRSDVEVAGWPTVDPFRFDPTIVTQRIEAAVAQRPVYLASLSNRFYDAQTLLQRYCVVPQDHLYRLYAPGDPAAADCLGTQAAVD